MTSFNVRNFRIQNDIISLNFSKSTLKPDNNNKNHISMMQWSIWNARTMQIIFYVPRSTSVCRGLLYVNRLIQIGDFFLSWSVFVGQIFFVGRNSGKTESSIKTAGRSTRMLNISNTLWNRFLIGITCSFQSCDIENDCCDVDGFLCVAFALTHLL